jgi:hypothetical protein
MISAVSEGYKKAGSAVIGMIMKEMSGRMFSYGFAG